MIRTFILSYCGIAVLIYVACFASAKVYALYSKFLPAMLRVAISLGAVYGLTILLFVVMRRLFRFFPALEYELHDEAGDSISVASYIASYGGFFIAVASSLWLRKYLRRREP